MYRTVARYPDPLEAHIVRGRLQAEGLDAHVADDQINIANWTLRQAVGGTRVLVADEDYAQAQAIVDAVDHGGFALETEDAAPAAPDRETFSSRLAFASFFLLGIPLPWSRRRRDETGADRRPF